VQKLSRWKIIISTLCTIIAFIYVLPNFKSIDSQFLPKNRINLGLDLMGGSHLLLEVDFDTYLNDVAENLADNLRKYLREEKIFYKNLIANKKGVSFNLNSPNTLDRITKIINKIDPDIAIKQDSVTNIINLYYNDAVLSQLLDKVLIQSIEIVRMRIDSSGTKEPIIQKQGNKYILLQMPGEKNPASLKHILGKTAKLAFHLVDETVDMGNNIVRKPISNDVMIVKSDNSQDTEHYVVIKKKPVVGGDQLTNAQASFNQNSQPVVIFSFNSIGSNLFAEATKQNIGKRLAIILDNKLLSAPMINEPILGGTGSISGNFTLESANELALLLRAGALPAPLKVVEERTIGPNLGTDSIEAGKKAGIIGFVAVVIFMVWSYGICGFFANIALTLALLYTLALLSIFDATLTLPGIAGIILTIGMAVDANILIYERIREELRKGSSNLYAIKLGFQSAFATITDSNVTTLAVALILYIFGVGTIKGFAITLAIGIVSSMFSAIIITKLLIDIWVKYFKPKNLGL
jgi:preprotein translocase subunit SecD